MLWDLFETFGLFDAIDTGPSRYHSTQHLGLMIALMGPPPKELLDRGSTSATYFDGDGQFRHPKLVPTGFSFESSITRLKGEDKELFINFAKKMICWLPEERWTAKQLLQHPWLKERKVEESADASTATLEDDAKRDGTTETNSSNRTSSSLAVIKDDPNASSRDVIRAILNRC